MEPTLQMIADVIPIVLAVIAFVMTSKSFTTSRRKSDNIQLLIMTACSGLLVVAQTSYWYSLFVSGSQAGTWFANIIWSVFNSLAMVAFIFAAKRARPLK